MDGQGQLLTLNEFHRKGLKINHLDYETLKYNFRKTHSFIQVNLDITDSMGPGKLVRHMQNPSYAYDEYLICINGLGPSISSVICKNPSYSGPSYPSSPVHHSDKETCSNIQILLAIVNVLFRGYSMSFRYLSSNNNYILINIQGKWLLELNEEIPYNTVESAFKTLQNIQVSMFTK